MPTHCNPAWLQLPFTNQRLYLVISNTRVSACMLFSCRTSQDDGMDKALRSSQAFFSQLQDQVRSQIKGSKDQAAKKKKKKEVSASKLKL